MKEFKTIDVIIQVFLIIGISIKSLLNLDQTYVYGYFIIGGCQVTSMIVHHINKWYTRQGTRRFYYHRITAITIIMVASFMPFTPIVWGILLYAAPALSACYLFICCREVFYPAKRPLDLI
jgi:hypothetical protein